MKEYLQEWSIFTFMPDPTARGGYCTSPILKSELLGSEICSGKVIIKYSEDWIVAVDV